MNFDDQQIAVLGAGTSGIAAARLSSSRGGKVTVYDSGQPEKLAAAAERLDSEGIAYIFGENALTSGEEGTDLVIVSPGIDLASDLAPVYSP